MRTNYRQTIAMNEQDRQLMAAAAVAAAKALDRQQGVFEFGTIRPDRFPSSSYQNWRDWRKHFAWVTDANRGQDGASDLFDRLGIG